MKNLVILLVFVAGFKSVSAQVLRANPMKTRLDTVVDNMATSYMLKSGRAGLSIGIITAKGMQRYHYGEISYRSGIIPDEHSIYEIGSITKTFTGLLVAKAIEEGKMDMNADIRIYLPESFSNLHYRDGGSIKVGSVLAHTAQFPYNFPKGGKSDFFKQLQDLKPDSMKFSRYVYSNVGYKLLGYVLERLYQCSYEELLVRYITNPLQMKGTQVSYLQKEKLLKGFDKNGREALPISTEMPAAGAIRSSLDDMMKYTSYQLAEQDPAVRMSHRVIFGNVDQEARGFQWAIGKTKNWDYYIRADGGTEGFRTFCALYPDEHIGIVLLSNQNDDTAGSGLYGIISEVLNELKNQKRSSMK